MATHYTVPTHFTAEGGQYASTLNGLKRKNREFAMGTKAIGKQIASYLTVGSAFTAGGMLGVESYNEAKNYEEAVDSFHTIVSELNDIEFKPFQDKIDQVATDTKRSGTEVAQAFEKVAGLNAEFANTADEIGTVTKAVITLSKASKMDLGMSAESLVGIMNQFSFSANQADRTINALAAGQAVGAASITESAEAFTIFGAEASRTNTTIEKSIGLIQTLAKYNIKGAEAGTKIRGVIGRLQKAGLGYSSGQFVINDALKQTNTILQKLKTNKEKDLFLNKLLGVENGTAGRILLQNVDLYEQFTKSVTGTNEAYRAAEINTGNLATSARELGAAWSRLITGSKDGKNATSQLSGAIKWLADNLETVVGYAWELAKGYLFIKGASLALNSATVAYNVVLGISNALKLQSISLLEGNIIATKASIITEKAMAAAIAISTGNWAALNAVMFANPALLVVGGIAALTAGVYLLGRAQKKYNEEQIRSYKANINRERILNFKEEEKVLADLIRKYVELGNTIEVARQKAVKANIEQLRREAFIGQEDINRTEKEFQAEKNKTYFSDLILGAVSNNFSVKANTGRRAEISEQLLEKKKGLRPTYEKLQSEYLYAKDLQSRGQMTKDQLRYLFPKEIKEKINPEEKTKPNASLPWGEQQAMVNQNLMKENALRDYYAHGKQPAAETNLKITITNNSTGEAVVEQSNGAMLFKVKPSSTNTTTLK